jgi:nicotinamide-nucleotide amidase
MRTIEDVISFLEQRELSVTTAESCTAGLVAALMAEVSGCGSVLQSGYIVYTEEAKNRCLGVSLQTIKEFGLTSEDVAKEMVIGALKNSSSQLAIAITGTAESNDSLNGVVCFAYGLRAETGYKLISETKKFEGTRNQVRKAAAMHAILSLPDFYKCLDKPSAINI